MQQNVKKNRCYYLIVTATAIAERVRLANQGNKPLLFDFGSTKHNSV